MHWQKIHERKKILQCHLPYFYIVKKPLTLEHKVAGDNSFDGDYTGIRTIKREHRSLRFIDQPIKLITMAGSL